LVKELEEVIQFDTDEFYLKQSESGLVWLYTALPLPLVAEVLLSALDINTPNIVREARYNNPKLFETISELALVRPEMGNSILYIWPGTAREIDGRLPTPNSALAKQVKYSIRKGRKVLYFGIGDGAEGSGIMQVIRNGGWKKIGKVVADAKKGTVARFGAGRRVFSEHLVRTLSLPLSLSSLGWINLADYLRLLLLSEPSLSWSNLETFQRKSIGQVYEELFTSLRSLRRFSRNDQES
jgi:hypothetical protein